MIISISVPRALAHPNWPVDIHFTGICNLDINYPYYRLCLGAWAEQECRLEPSGEACDDNEEEGW